MYQLPHQVDVVWMSSVASINYIWHIYIVYPVACSVMAIGTILQHSKHVKFSGMACRSPNIVIRTYYMAYNFSGLSVHKGIDKFSSLQHVNLKNIQ